MQGWLKGTNSTSLSPVHDMGGDGNGPHTAGQYIARDATGFALHYYDNDYKAIGTGVTPFPGLAAYLGADARPLYNGNISSMAVHIGSLPGAVLYNYEYDRLNRITGMDMWKGFNPSGNDWTAITVSTDYKERVAYDPNGNILKYLRNTAGTTTAMDSMKYHYYAGTNRLSHIKDNAPSGIEYNDIEDQIAHNYAYDSIGNLTSDSSEHISQIDWNVYGKITGITRSTPSAGSNTRQINYRYDAAGNRIGKKTAYFGTSEVSHTWYVRDASGNVMAVYTAKKDTASSAAIGDFALTLSEQHVYGSSRLGIQRRKVDMEGSFTPGQVVNHVQGEKSFELANHLGNVLTTISDRRKGIARTDSVTKVGYYLADVQTAQDYFIFGMLMPGRSGYQTRGGWAQGNQTVNGTSIPELLTLESRENDMPPEYKATREVVFTGEYVTGTGDEFLAYIATESNTGTGSGEGNGQGVVSGYPFGHNGTMKDNDVQGEGNFLDYGMRVYDPRAPHFWSVDPLTKQYPELSPYIFASNSPIESIDQDGLERSPAGKKGIFAIDETAVQRYHDAIPVIAKQNATVAQNKFAERVLGAMTKSYVSTAPVMSIPEKARHEALSDSKREDAGYNKDGSKKPLTALADNKHFNSFAERMALPILSDMATIEGFGGGALLRKLTQRSAGVMLAEIEASIPGAHFFSRHGAETSLSSQYMRAVSGMAPDKVVTGEVNATRFLNNKLQLDAVKKAEAHFLETGETNFKFDMGATVGEGYLKGGGGGSYRTTSEVQAVFKDKKLITLYPRIKK